MIAVVLRVANAPSGVLQAMSAQPDAFAESDVHFLETAARWVGMVAHRAQLVEQVAAEATQQGRRMAAEELITVMAHDLGNHLTPLKGRIGLIRQRAIRENRPVQLADADELMMAFGRLNRLITDLLDVGRLEQGLFAVSPQPLNLVGLVHDIAAAFQNPETEIQVHAPEELEISADPVRLRQAVENLVSNAIRHSPDGAPITLTVEDDRQADGRWAVVRVTDQGPGIAPALHPRLFTRFTPGPGSTGLGLGLYLASSIATAHGGTLSVDSTLGAGATFRLRLPIAATRTWRDGQV